MKKCIIVYRIEKNTLILITDYSIIYMMIINITNSINVLL